RHEASISSVYRSKHTCRSLCRAHLIIESDLESTRRLLVGPPDASLHFLLDPVERVPLDQRAVGSRLDAPVRSGEPAVHGIPEDVRHGLARPRPSRLRPVTQAVQLLADLRDPLPLQVSAVDVRDDLRLLIVHLEGAIDVPVPERARVVQEAAELLRLVRSGGPGDPKHLVPTEELVLAESLLCTEPPDCVLLGLRAEVAYKLPLAGEHHEQLPTHQDKHGTKIT